METYSSVSLNQGSEIQLCFLDVQILAFLFFTFFQRRQKRFQNFKYEDKQNSIVQYLNCFFPKGEMFWHLRPRFAALALHFRLC